MSEKKWVVKDLRPYCRFCDSLLRPVDEPLALRCPNCGREYLLSEDELAELTFDLSD